MENFKSTLNKGFQMTFENGLTISVQFGGGNYCKNRNNDFMAESKIDVVESPNAEIAIWDEHKRWFNFGGDEVKGYVSPDEVAKWIYKVSRAKSIKTIKRIKY